MAALDELALFSATLAVCRSITPSPKSIVDLQKQVGMSRLLETFRLASLFCAAILCMGCGDRGSVSRDVPSTLRALDLRVYQLRDDGTASEILVAGQPIHIEGSLHLTTESRVRDKLLVRVVRKMKDGQEMIAQSGTVTIRKESNLSYSYHGELSGVRKSGAYVVVVGYLDKSNTTIDSTEIVIVSD